MEKGKKSDIKRSVKVTKKQIIKSESPKKTEKKEKPKVSFDSWFSLKVSEKKIRSHWYVSIKIYFKEKGLSQDEEPDKFDECLKLY